MAINSYVGNEIVSSTDTFNVWLTRTNSLITDMGSVVVSVGDNNVGDVTITGALGANTVFAGTELRGGDANTSASLSITSATDFASNVTISGETLFDGASANVTIDTLNFVVNSSNTIFNDHVEFENDMIIPVGTTVQRVSNTTGSLRFNTTTGKFEGYTGSNWELRADTADILTTARTINISGDVAGSASFNGGNDITISTTIQNTAQTQETIADVVGGMVSGNSETGIDVVYQDVDNTLDFTVNPSAIDHDSLQNFVANEHVDHSSVSITAGTGLSGGGDITASRTLNVVVGDGLVANSSGIHLDTIGNFETLDTNNLYVDSLYANGATGSAGDFLATNGNTVYWASVSEFTGESDTLDTVTDRGAITTNDITVGGISISNNTPTFAISGDITGSAIFDGSNVDIVATANASVIATVSYVDTEINNLIDAAPGTLDTLNELANALGDDPNFATTVTNSLSTKVDNDTQIIAGSGLSGGGDLTTSRTLNVGAGTGIIVGANEISIGQDVSTTSNVEFSDISTSTITANGSIGTAGQVLTASGTGIYWSEAFSFSVGNNTTSDTVQPGDTVKFIGGNNISVNHDTVNNTLTFDAAAGVAPNDGTLTISSGNGLSGGGTFSADQSTDSTITIVHDETSNQLSVNNSGTTFIQDVTLDSFGHVTGLNSQTLTLSGLGFTGETNADNYGGWTLLSDGISRGEISSGEGVNFVGGSGISLSYSATNNTINISNDISAPENSTIFINAGDALSGGGSFSLNQAFNETITIDHVNTSTQASLTALTGANVISDIDLDTYGHVTSLSTRTMTLSDLGYEGDTNADNYNSWDLLVDGLTKNSITSASNVNFVGGSGISLSYSATNNTITIDSSSGAYSYDVSVEGTTQETITSGEVLDFAGTTNSIDVAWDATANGLKFDLSNDVTINGKVAINNNDNLATNYQLVVRSDNSPGPAGAFYGTSSSSSTSVVETVANQTNGYYVWCSYGSFSNLVGGIAPDGITGVSFNQTSDYRLKENIVDLTGAAVRLRQIPVRRFSFIGDAERGTVDGFIAHEVQPYVPEAIKGQKDEVDENGKAKYQAIDQSKLVPLLTASLQEALDKIDELEARIANLETP